MHSVLGFGLAAGKGVRLQPLTLKASGYIRAKAVVRFLGQRLIHWLLPALRAQGLDNVLMITHGKENRGQIKSCLGYGEACGMDVRYSPVSLDVQNTGSGSAFIANLEHFDLCAAQGVVFPTDSLFDIDLPGMLAAHRQQGAMVTIATVRYPAEAIAGRYGLILQNAEHRVQGFLEKPSLDEIHRQYPLSNDAQSAMPGFDTSAGLYIVDIDMLRAVARHADIVAMRNTRCDIGSDLLPWLVDHGYPVYSYGIARMGDLGNIPSYLETMVDTLRGKFAASAIQLPRDASVPAGCFIDQTSYQLRDPHSNLTLGEKLSRGLVTVLPPVRIGKYVRIDPGVTLSACNIDDECELHEEASIVRSSIGEGALIGAHTRLTDTVLGTMVTIHSTRQQPVELSDFTALGDEVTVHAGVTMRARVTVYPRVTIPSGIHLDTPDEITSSESLPKVAASRGVTPHVLL